jgi:hypothetical protein
LKHKTTKECEFLKMKANNGGKGTDSAIKDIEENRNLNEARVEASDKVKCKVTEIMTLNEVTAKLMERAAKKK